MGDLTEQRSDRTSAIVVETLCSVLAVTGVGLLLVDWFVIEMTTQDVDRVVDQLYLDVFHGSIAAIGLGTAGALGAAYWRAPKTGWSVAWHGTVAVVGIVLAVLFQLYLG